MLKDQIDEILRNPASLENGSHKTIYHSLLDPDANKGRPLPSRLSLYQEAAAVLGAGSDSTSIAATVISYHVLHNPEVQRRLVNELRRSWPVLEEVPRYEVFEKLPYLASPDNDSWFDSSPERPSADCGYQRGPSHVSREPSATACCSPRRSDDSWSFHSWRGKSWVIMWPSRFRCMLTRSQAVVGQSSLYVHRSPAVFSDPVVFIPDRWLGEDAKTHEASLVPFSKGPRSCIGINLAYCELFIVIAGIFRRFDVTLDAKRFVVIAMLLRR